MASLLTLFISPLTVISASWAKVIFAWLPSNVPPTQTSPALPRVSLLTLPIFPVTTSNLLASPTVTLSLSPVKLPPTIIVVALSTLTVDTFAKSWRIVTSLSAPTIKLLLPSSKSTLLIVTSDFLPQVNLLFALVPVIPPNAINSLPLPTVMFSTFCISFSNDILESLPALIVVLNIFSRPPFTISCA